VQLTHWRWALKKDGTVVCWGNPARVPSGLSNVVAIAASPSFFGRDLVLKGDGTVVEWVVRGTEMDLSSVSNVVVIAAGANHGLALKKDGTVFGWGSNVNGEATGVSAEKAPYISSGLVTIGGEILTNVVTIAAGDNFCLAITTNSAVADKLRQQ
jgi:alpha-tubulin suppressor-like RCC1 family protein